MYTKLTRIIIVLELGLLILRTFITSMCLYDRARLLPRALSLSTNAPGRVLVVRALSKSNSEIWTRICPYSALVSSTQCV